ncbi:hypothetical protein B296_00012526 [Ensete ventricosum]|uniref:Uncharacterized protein n=1 Tax=Ensete ventricosum TaxID=4639 RepID=A0A427AAQ3_ENSVE|nr:hypothetical protein B296_00012526 [Ensete ventricosum]
MAKHHGESSKMGQAGHLPQVVAGGLQVQIRSQAVGAAHEEHDSEQDEQAGSQIDRVESLVDRLTKDTKDSIRHPHEVVVELTAKVTLLTRTLITGGDNICVAPP